MATSILSNPIIPKAPNVFRLLPKPFFVLAPMDDVTDTVFRQIIGSCAAPDLYFTEFVNVDGLQSPGREHLMKKILFTANEQPIVAQLWGKDPENFRKTAIELIDMGFAGIDINMGCPAKSEVNNGTCSALINNRPLAVDIIKATQAGAAGRVPVSVKTRLGFSAIDMTWPELLLQQNLAMLTIHGRTRKEMSKVPAHWDEIGQVRQIRDDMDSSTLIVGNGDVMNRQHGLELAEKYQLDGIMIGRGIFHDPYAFADSDGATDSDSPWQRVSKQERIDLYIRHVSLFAETWQGSQDDRSDQTNQTNQTNQMNKSASRPIQTLNKFCKIYINGFDGAKELREQLMQASSTEELLEILRNLN